MLKIGIAGLGYLGAIHLEQWSNIVDSSLIYCYDHDKSKLDELSNRFQFQIVDTYGQLLETCDIIDIVTPTTFHFELAKQGLLAGKHLFIEKPVCETMEQVNELIALQKQSKTLIQIGHVERYNPAFSALENKLTNPKFFEIHRLAPYVARGTEVSVIMDLMIHDLDIVLSLVDSPVKNIYANGVGVLNMSPDIANVRMEFENGCVANLTSSRISMKKMRKMRVFTDHGYASIDFLTRESEWIEINDEKSDVNGLVFVDNLGINKKMSFEKFEKSTENPIFLELKDFFEKINCQEKKTKIDLVFSSKVLENALVIQNKISETI